MRTGLAASRNEGATQPLFFLAHAEIEQIEKVHRELAPRFAVVPMTPEEPIGAERLRALAQPRSGPRAA